MSPKWNRKEIIHFLEKLEMYQSAGLPLDQVLVLIRNGSPSRHRPTLSRVISSVESGGFLSESLSNELQISPTLSGLIEHGESSGKLAESILTARSLLERQDELIKKCLSAMMYPLVIGIFSGLLTIGLIRGVMPQIIPMLKSLNVQLPILTRAVMFTSEIIVSYGIYIVVGLLALLLLFFFANKRSNSFRMFNQSVLLKLPILGGLIWKYSFSVFMRAFGSLIESGVSINEAYSKTVRTVSLLPLRNKLKDEIPEINRGVQLSAILDRLKIPADIFSLIAAGETSGTLGTSMLRVAGIIDREIEHSLKKVTALVEPMMMAGMGCIVGAIALSIMLPIYDISRVLQR